MRIIMQTQAQVDAKAAEQAREQERAAINARFAELDQARARPLAAYALGRQTPADTARLTEIEDEAARLRARLAELRAEEIKP